VTDSPLSDEALAELLRLARQVGSPSEEKAEYQVLWDNKLIMGGTSRCHITHRGKELLRRAGLL
jgi:hypothetical protein